MKDSREGKAASSNNTGKDSEIRGGNNREGNGYG